MAGTNLTAEIRISQNGVTVRKRFVPSTYEVPAIELSVKSNRTSPSTVRIREKIPSFYPVEDVAFHPDYEAENWHRSGSQTVIFERTIEPNEQFETVYGLRVQNKTEATKFQTRPKITVSVPSSQEAEPSAPENVLERIIREMDGYEFEHFIAEVWKERGWTTSVTEGSNDNGVDIIATRDGLFSEKHLIQAKKFADTSVVSSPDIQKYASLHLNPDVDAVVVVTTSSFSGPAKEIAKRRNVKLVDEDGIKTLIREMDLDDLIDEYTK